LVKGQKKGLKRGSGILGKRSKNCGVGGGVRAGYGKGRRRLEREKWRGKVVLKYLRRTTRTQEKKNKKNTRKKKRKEGKRRKEKKKPETERIGGHIE